MVNYTIHSIEPEVYIIAEPNHKFKISIIMDPSIKSLIQVNEIIICHLSFIVKKPT